MSSKITVETGTAHVCLDAAAERRTANGKSSLTYLYDDVLHAAMRLGMAVLSESQQDDMLRSLSHLRSRLLGEATDE